VHLPADGRLCCGAVADHDRGGISQHGIGKVSVERTDRSSGETYAVLPAGQAFPGFRSGVRTCDRSFGSQCLCISIPQTPAGACGYFLCGDGAECGGQLQTAADSCRCEPGTGALAGCAGGAMDRAAAQRAYAGGEEARHSFDLLHHGCRDFYPEQICDPAINILRKYDLDNHTELNLTLKTYIEKQYNAVATASELCIARSTFLKRYERIEKLTGIDLNDFQRRIYLALSYELFHQQHKKSEK